MIIFLRVIAFVLIGLMGYTSYMFKSELIAAVTFTGFLAGVIFMASYILDLQHRLKSYKRELEKSSVNTIENSSKVQVLESKIEVLEKALKNALEQK